MKQCLFCYEKLNDRQAAIRHLDVAHQLVKAAVPQDGNAGDFYQPEGCSNWQPGDALQMLQGLATHELAQPKPRPRGPISNSWATS